MKAAYLLLLFALMPVLAPRSAAQDPGEGLSVVEGTVVAEGTGLPLARARILLAKAENPRQQDALAAMTDAEGKFVIPNVVPGTYRLFVGRSGYATIELGQPFFDKPGVPLAVGANQAIRVPVALTPVASVRGKVKNQFGAGVPKFLVKALKARYEKGERVLTGGEYTVTDENGEFQLFDVTPGWYFLSAEPGEDYAQRDLAVGIVNWPAFHGGLTEAEATPVRLNPGEMFDAGTLTVLRTAAVHVRGAILDAETGKPESDTRIVVGRKLRQDVAMLGRTAMSWIPVPKPGDFDLAAVPPGNYVLNVLTPSTSGSATVEVRAGDINDVKILLYPRVNVSGRIQMDGGSAETLAKLRIVLESGHSVAESAIAPSGDFTVMGVLGGTQRVSLEGVPNAYLKTVLLDGEKALDAGLSLAPKPGATMEITAGIAAARVDIAVADTRDRPAVRALAALVPDAPRRGRLELYRSAATGPDGHALFENVVPGDYKIVAWEFFDANAWQDPDIFRAYENQAQPLRIGEAGATASIKLTPLWSIAAPK